MINLGSWMNGILISWGVDPKIANTFDEMIIAALLVILAIGLTTCARRSLSAV